MELSFQLSGVGFEEGETFLLITLIYFLVHGFFLNNLLGDMESLAGTLLVEHRGSVRRFEPCIKTAIFAPRGGHECTTAAQDWHRGLDLLVTPWCCNLE
ncbi:hypothetical protein TMatcc_003927 [Talaromyces marneffei ATCC 18224]